MAIGIFDSGIGGLSIYKSIKKILPNEDFVYVADKKFFPYGLQSTETIRERGDAIISWFKTQNVKLIVVACNTSTVSALEYLRELYTDIPIVGTVPVIKTCAERTKTGKIGVMCTPKTSESAYQTELIKKFAPTNEVYVTACPDLVEEIESGEFKESSSTLSEPLSILFSKNIDTLALGCTHFPLIGDTIKKITGSKVLVLDSGPAIARQIKTILEKNNISSSSSKTGRALFYTTSDPQNFDIMIDRYLNINTNSQLINI